MKFSDVIAHIAAYAIIAAIVFGTLGLAIMSGKWVLGLLGLI